MLPGCCAGLYLFAAGLKVWRGTNDWVERPKLEVAMEADVEAVVNMVLDRLTL